MTGFCMKETLAFIEFKALDFTTVFTSTRYFFVLSNKTLLHNFLISAVSYYCQKHGINVITKQNYLDVINYAFKRRQVQVRVRVRW